MAKRSSPDELPVGFVLDWTCGGMGGGAEPFGPEAKFATPFQRVTTMLTRVIHFQKEASFETEDDCPPVLTGSILGTQRRQTSSVSGKKLQQVGQTFIALDYDDSRILPDTRPM